MRRLARNAAVLVLSAVLSGALAACGDDAGAGELTAFVEFGPIAFDGGAPAPIELESGAAPDDLVGTLRRAEAANLADAEAALDHGGTPGSRAFAFVLPGCQDTGAVLTVTDTTIDASLTGNENVSCAVAVYFLATFEIAADDVPPAAELDTN